METWLPISGYVGLYEVSDQGRVRSLAHSRHNGVAVPAAIVTCSFGDDGYARVSLRDLDSRKRNLYVHQLVLTAFVGPRPANHVACHGPAGSVDNSLSNLRWGTKKSNMADRYRDGTASWKGRHSSLPSSHV